MNFQFPEEDDEIELKFSFGHKIDNSTLNKNYSKTPLFGYDYIDLNETDYNFSQLCFDNTDAKKYYEKVNHLSNNSIFDLIDNSHRDLHFHIYDFPKGNLRHLLITKFGDRNIRDEVVPPIGQFALYTRSNANRSTGVKSPRIYFIIGYYAIFYLLFYDPFHEINPVN